MVILLHHHWKGRMKLHRHTRAPIWNILTYTQHCHSITPSLKWTDETLRTHTCSNMKHKVSYWHTGNIVILLHHRWNGRMKLYGRTPAPIWNMKCHTDIHTAGRTVFNNFQLNASEFEVRRSQGSSTILVGGKSIKKQSQMSKYLDNLSGWTLVQKDGHEIAHAPQEMDYRKRTHCECMYKSVMM